jgi:hypothetical protein
MMRKYHRKQFAGQAVLISVSKHCPGKSFLIKKDPSTPQRWSILRLLQLKKRILGAKFIGHVSVRGPVVFPPLPVYQVFESVCPSRRYGDRGAESSVFSHLHGICFGIPGVEVTAKRCRISIYSCRKVKSNPAGTAGFRITFFQHGIIFSLSRIKPVRLEKKSPVVRPKSRSVCQFSGNSMFKAAEVVGAFIYIKNDPISRILFFQFTEGFPIFKSIQVQTQKNQIRSRIFEC